MAESKPGNPKQADWLYANRASLHNAGEALRSYLFAVNVLTEGIAQKGIALPDAKRRLFVRGVQGFHQCLRRLSEQSFPKGDEQFSEMLRELETLIEGTENKLGIRVTEAKPVAPKRGMRRGRSLPLRSPLRTSRRRRRWEARSSRRRPK